MIPRNNARRRDLTVTAILLLCGSVGAQVLIAQNDQPTLVDRILDYSDQITIINDADVVSADVKRALFDIRLNELDHWSVESNKWLGASEGNRFRNVLKMTFVKYDGFFYPRVIQMQVADRAQLQKQIGVEPDRSIADGTHLKFEYFPQFGLHFLSNPRPGVATFADGDFYAFANERTAKKRVPEILAAPKIASQLDQSSRDLINRYGVSLILRGENASLDNLIDSKSILENSQSELSPDEQQWLKEFAALANATERKIIGLKYHEKALEIRTRVKIESGSSCDGLIDLSMDSAAWKPDLGLESDGLLLAGAIQMEAFRSSAATRILPQVILKEVGNSKQFRWLQGNMLRVLSELVGDSWNDLTAARIALYRNANPMDLGQLSLIGVTDARDPAIVSQELRRLSVLTIPTKTEEGLTRQAAEIERLIVSIGSDDFDVASRAQTRLILAGQSAVDSLRAASSSEDSAIKIRVAHILKRIEQQELLDRNQFAVADPNFWSTLNPGLQFQDSTGNLGGFETHTIAITPDSSKSKEDIDAATEAMKYQFGPNWHTVKVVQVDQHFLFLIGSDQDLFAKIIDNVNHGRQPLTAKFEGVGFGPKHGQLHAFAGMSLMADMFVPRPNFAGIPKPEIFELTWAHLNFESQHLDGQILLPASDVWGLFRLGF